MIIDRKIAQDKFKETINTYNDWIYIIGGTNSGKSYFVKEITKNLNSIYCAPNHEFDYWKGFLKEIKHNSETIINRLSKSINLDLLDKSFLGDLSKSEYEEILEYNILNEIRVERTKISKFLGQYLSERYNYIVLDNLYKCDIKSYKWLVSLLDTFSENKGCYIIVVCDTDRKWSYQELKEDLCGRFSRVNVNKYDDYKAYSELINTVFHFNNEQILFDIAKKLYKNFNGRAQDILTLIKQLNNDRDFKNLSDKEKEEIILEKAAYLTLEAFNNLNYSSKILLALLALSPVPLSAKAIEEILALTEETVNKSILECQSNDLIKSNINGTVTEYSLTDFLTKETYIQFISENQIVYNYEKLFRAYKSNLIHLNDKDAVKLAMKVDASELDDISFSYFHGISSYLKDENTFAELLNDYINYCNNLPDFLLNTLYVDILYRFGYYQTAYKLITSIKHDNETYSYLMKKGDIEHLILHKNTADTFEKAAKVDGITISQKLSAVNRQIMALTQEDKSKLTYARKLYCDIVKKYSNNECDGLVELYRNSNNIFPYNEALEYSIKGYNLAKKLNNNIDTN